MDVYQYKKVLVISNVPITPYSAQGASRGSWFKTWDKDKLALMTFCEADENDGFCNHYFTVTRNEKAFIRFFSRKASSAISSQNVNTEKNDQAHTSKRSRLKSNIKYYLQSITRPRYSKSLSDFLDAFEPDAIFSAVADAYGARLTQKISKKRNIPYIIQQEDNWLTNDLDHSPISKATHKNRVRALKKSLNDAAKRYVICPNMKTHFEAEFNMDFECLFCAEDPNRFLLPETHDAAVKTQFLYIGNSKPDRSGGFVKIAQAIKNANIINPEFIIYSTNADKNDVEALNKFGFVKFEDVPHHDDVAKKIANAHVLILCESFDKRVVEYTKLALSSKVQIYMMAKIPILVFAPKQTGVMDYALAENFAMTVQNDDMDTLTKAVSEITNDSDLRKDYVTRAINVADKNHHALIVRKDLCDVINAMTK